MLLFLYAGEPAVKCRFDLQDGFGIEKEVVKEVDWAIHARSFLSKPTARFLFLFPIWNFPCL